MARNVEIKARVNDLPGLLARIEVLSLGSSTHLQQDDTFFTCATGRLKLRAFSQNRGELIFYQRSNTYGPKESFYLRTPTSEPDLLRQALTLAYGQIGRVRKQRRLFISGRTRIHVDHVESLGHFVELEVVLSDNEDVKAGEQEAAQYMTKLGITDESLIDKAYLDLLLTK